MINLVNQKGNSLKINCLRIRNYYQRLIPMCLRGPGNFLANIFHKYCNILFISDPHLHLFDHPQDDFLLKNIEQNNR